MVCLGMVCLAVVRRRQTGPSCRRGRGCGSGGRSRGPARCSPCDGNGRLAPGACAVAVNARGTRGSERGVEVGKIAGRADGWRGGGLAGGSGRVGMGRVGTGGGFLPGAGGWGGRGWGGRGPNRRDWNRHGWNRHGWGGRGWNGLRSGWRAALRPGAVAAGARSRRNGWLGRLGGMAFARELGPGRRLDGRQDGR